MTACLGLTSKWWGCTVVVITTGVMLTTTSCAPVRAAPSQQYQQDVHACDQDPVWGSKLLCWQHAQHAEYTRRGGSQMRYRARFNTIASISVEVDADDEDAAIEAAYTKLPVNVCAQCAGWGQSWSMDLGEWTTGGFTAAAGEPVDVVEEVQ